MVGAQVPRCPPGHSHDIQSIDTEINRANGAAPCRSFTQVNLPLGILTRGKAPANWYVSCSLPHMSLQFSLLTSTGRTRCFRPHHGLPAWDHCLHLCPLILHTGPTRRDKCSQKFSKKKPGSKTLSPSSSLMPPKPGLGLGPSPALIAQAYFTLPYLTLPHLAV